jgi:hypothetical protein
MHTSEADTLGVLQLQNKPMMFKGCLSHPETFDFRAITLPVADAWVSNMVAGDASLEHNFIAAAKELVRRGATAITTNCGFAIRYQQAMARALPVPVATSTLLIVPLVAAMTGGRVGLLTFDSRPLTADVLRLAGIGDEPRVPIVGLEGTATYEIMSRPDAPITVAQIEDDLLAAIERLRRDEHDVTALVFECAGFPVASARVRDETQLPVYDVTSMCQLLMSSASPFAAGAPRH